MGEVGLPVSAGALVSCLLLAPLPLLSLGTVQNSVLSSVAGSAEGTPVSALTHKSRGETLAKWGRDPRIAALRTSLLEARSARRGSGSWSLVSLGLAWKL